MRELKKKKQLLKQRQKIYGLFTTTFGSLV